MQKRVFIIHGHQGKPDEHWLPWLRRELVQRGYLVAVPPMPHADWPTIKMWTSHIQELVGHCDDHTYIVGHSIGCQAILRYLQSLVLPTRAGGAVFVAGFEHMKLNPLVHPFEYQQLKEWIDEPIHWEAIRGKSKNFTAIFSDNDDVVPLDNVKVFDEKLDAQTIVLHNKGHFTADDGVTELPEVLEVLLPMLESA